MTITLENVTVPDPGPFEISVTLTGNIRLGPEAARHRVSVFVGNQIADLLYGEAPDLVLRENGFFGRVPVVLACRSKGRLGLVGKIDVPVETGELNITPQVISKIEQNAERFAFDETAAAIYPL